MIREILILNDFFLNMYIFDMYSVVNQFSYAIQEHKNTFVRLVLIYCFILHIISTILTEKTSLSPPCLFP